MQLHAPVIFCLAWHGKADKESFHQSQLRDREEVLKEQRNGAQSLRDERQRKLLALYTAESRAHAIQVSKAGLSIVPRNV